MDPPIPTDRIAVYRRLFPAGQGTRKAEVAAAVRVEFESAGRAVAKRLSGLVRISAVDGMIAGGSPDIRPGTLGLLDFIGKYESTGNYNAIVDHAKNENTPQLTKMTISQILAFQSSLGGRNACGKYQVIHDTLEGTYAACGLSAGSLFEADAQDRIGYHLLMTVRGGDAYLKSGGNDADTNAFALKVAQEWAAMPVLIPMQGHGGVAISRGDSYYSGKAGNRALTTAEAFEAAIAKFRAEALAAKS